MSIAELSAIIGLTVGIVTLIGIAMKVGRSVGRIEEGQRQLLEHLPNLRLIPILETRIGTLENVSLKHTSEIKGLLTAQARLAGENTGRFRALSRPDPEEAGK